PATGALSIPVSQTSTFAQKSVDHFGKYDYSRSGNPTREALEEAVASLEGKPRICLRLRNGGHLLDIDAFCSGRPSGRLRGRVRRCIQGNDEAFQPVGAQGH